MKKFARFLVAVVGLVLFTTSYSQLQRLALPPGEITIAPKGKPGSIKGSEAFCLDRHIYAPSDPTPYSEVLSTSAKVVYVGDSAPISFSEAIRREILKVEGFGRGGLKLRITNLSNKPIKIRNEDAIAFGTQKGSFEIPDSLAILRDKSKTYRDKQDLIWNAGTAYRRLDILRRIPRPFTEASRKETLLAYQKEKGLTATGMMDDSTASALARDAEALIDDIKTLGFQPEQRTDGSSIIDLSDFLHAVQDAWNRPRSPFLDKATTEAIAVEKRSLLEGRDALAAGRRWSPSPGSNALLVLEDTALVDSTGERLVIHEVNGDLIGQVWRGDRVIRRFHGADAANSVAILHQMTLCDSSFAVPNQETIAVLESPEGVFVYALDDFFPITAEAVKKGELPKELVERLRVSKKDVTVLRDPVEFALDNDSSGRLAKWFKKPTVDSHILAEAIRAVLPEETKVTTTVDMGRHRHNQARLGKDPTKQITFYHDPKQVNAYPTLVNAQPIIEEAGFRIGDIRDIRANDAAISVIVGADTATFRELLAANSEALKGSIVIAGKCSDTAEYAVLSKLMEKAGALEIIHYREEISALALQRTLEEFARMAAVNPPSQTNVASLLRRAAQSEMIKYPNLKEALEVVSRAIPQGSK